MYVVSTSANLPTVVLSSWIGTVHRQMCQFLQGLYATFVEYGELCFHSHILCLCIAKRLCILLATLFLFYFSPFLLILR